jgi:hypothetical protein
MFAFIVDHKLGVVKVVLGLMRGILEQVSRISDHNLAKTHYFNAVF